MPMLREYRLLSYLTQKWRHCLGSPTVTLHAARDLHHCACCCGPRVVCEQAAPPIPPQQLRVPVLTAMQVIQRRRILDCIFPLRLLEPGKAEHEQSKATSRARLWMRWMVWAMALAGVLASGEHIRSSQAPKA